MPSNIIKLYASNFLVGLVFWYGIEKLFMQNIGIDAVGIGITIAVLFGFNLVFDIPSGILADKWSRKGTLMIGVVSLALCSLLLGLTNGLALYLVGYILYGVKIVATSGTYQALIYDSLYEKGLANQYSKTTGRAFALFLAGAGVADLASGFLASAFDYRFTFFISIIPCVLNLLIIASIKEPTFHKAAQKEKILGQIGQAFKSIANITLLRGLAIIMTTLIVVEIFKVDFGQIYILRYVSSPELLGILWAVFAFAWAIGSAVAHRMRNHMNLLVFATVLPLVFMSLVDTWLALVLFMIQSIASAALLNQIETRVQDATPSAVRASILSVLSSLGRAVAIPASIGLGWIIHTYNILWALYCVTIVGVAILLYWLWLHNKTKLAA